MNDLIEFLSFSDPNIRYVALGSMLLTGSSAIVGTFAFLKKKALVGDAIAHAVLPGICLAFMLAGRKDPLTLIAGALVTGWLSVIFIDYITRLSKIKEDTAIALVLAVFFGFGSFLLSIIQQSGNAAQSGLNNFLFGKAASLVGADLLTFSIIAVLLIVSVRLLFKEFTLIAFDSSFATVIGFPVKWIEFILTSLTVLAVVIGIQSVGVVLMAAMLITPAAAARFWTHRIEHMIFLAAFFGAFSGLTGAYISWLAPSMPTGPWIVVTISVIAFFSFFFAPKKGIYFRIKMQKNLKKKINDENILKVMYMMGEEQESIQRKTIGEIMEWRDFELPKLIIGLNRLRKDGFVKKENQHWLLTNEGKNKGRKIVKLHRLWEVYLTKYLRIAPDHVHDDAETIEHIITPELEEELEKLLDYPVLDPHQSKIPYDA